MRVEGDEVAEKDRGSFVQSKFDKLRVLRDKYVAIGMRSVDPGRIGGDFLPAVVAVVPAKFEKHHGRIRIVEPFLHRFPAAHDRHAHHGAVFHGIFLQGGKPIAHKAVSPGVPIVPYALHNGIAKDLHCRSFRHSYPSFRASAGGTKQEVGKV